MEPDRNACAFRYGARAGQIRTPERFRIDRNVTNAKSGGHGRGSFRSDRLASLAVIHCKLACYDPCSRFHRPIVPKAWHGLARVVLYDTTSGKPS